MWGQRLKLLRRCHPKTLEYMRVHRNADGTLWQPTGGSYTNLCSTAEHEEAPVGFIPYVPEEFTGHWRTSVLAARNEDEVGPTVPRKLHVITRDKLKPAKATHFRLRHKSPAARLLQSQAGYKSHDNGAVREQSVPGSTTPYSVEQVDSPGDNVEGGS